MGSRFMARCMSLCITCIVLFVLLPISTSYAEAAKVYAFQVMRPDPNRPESQGQVVQSVRIKYFLEDSASPGEIVKCIQTPQQDWSPFQSQKSFKFGSNVEFKVYTNTDCSGADATSQIYPGTSALLALVPAKGQVKADTCYMNLNVFPSGNLSGCNTGQ